MAVPGGVGRVRRNLLRRTQAVDWAADTFFRQDQFRREWGVKLEVFRQRD